MAPVTIAIAPRTVVKAAVVVAVFIPMVAALHATRTVIAELTLAAVLAALVRPGVLYLARRTRLGFAIFAVYAALVIGVIAVLSAEAGALGSGTRQLRHA